MKKAFTLAEILVTLSIIGVIASMTIPSLVQDVQDAQNKTAWKRAFSDLNQTALLIRSNNGGSLKYLFNPGNQLCNEFKKYLNYTKECGNGNFGCWHPVSTNRLNNTNENRSYFDDGGLILNNGYLVAFEDPLTTNYDFKHIFVDVNGLKGPNKFGKDVYAIKVYRDGIKPAGSQGDGNENTCSPSSTGWGCSAKYLYQ